MLSNNGDLEAIKILLVDDHNLFAEGTAALLMPEANFTVLGIAGNGNQCLQLLRETTPDVILLDISLPDCSGINLIDEIKLIHPTIKIIMLTGLNPTGYLPKLLSKGVQGLLLKESTKKEMVEAIQYVVQGKDYFSQALAPFMKSVIVDNDNSETVKLHDRLLTPREQEIMESISIGLRNREIAAKLGVKSRTIDFHVSNILSKLGVKTRIEAMLTYAKDKAGNDDR